jgi:hypothetical protein
MITILLSSDERGQKMDKLQYLIEIVQDLLKELKKIDRELDKFEELEAVSLLKVQNTAISELKNSEINTVPHSPSNIIPFPGKKGFFTPKNTKRESSNYGNEGFFVSKPLIAAPGEALPPNIHDYRPLLQRDGLILLAWDKRITEKGELYTAYWVTSAGVARFYASKPHSPDDFFLAQPDHKSYAAEDGIEFYGQEAPAYIVHIAPELMMNNPRHRELRQAHIETLRQQGNIADFNYKYLLKTAKKHGLSNNKEKAERSRRKAGA